MRFPKTLTEQEPRPPAGAEVLMSVGCESGDQTETFFDLNVEVTREDIGKMRKVIEQFRMARIWGAYLTFASAFVHLFPETRSEFVLSDKDVKKLDDFIKEDQKHITSSPTHSLSLAQKFLSLYPTHEGMVALDELSEVMAKRIKELRTKDELIQYIYEAYNLALLFPKGVNGFDDEVFQKINGLLQGFNGGQSFNGTIRPDNAYLITSRVVVLFPQHREEINIDKSLFQVGQKKLKRFRNFNRWDDFAETALALKILSSVKTEIVGIGQLVVTLPAPKIMAESKPLPERSVV
jgi:hypothetical protein